MRWSYKTVHFSLKKEGLLGSAFLDEDEIEISLNEYGHAGWELVSMMEVNDGLIAVFKQPLARGAAAVIPKDASDRVDQVEEKAEEPSAQQETEKRPPADEQENRKEGDTDEADVGSIRIF